MDFQINFCEYNRTNPLYDRVYRPHGSGDYLFLLLKTPMRFYIGDQVLLTYEHACMLYTPQVQQHYEAVHKFRNSYIHFSCSEPLDQRFGIPSNDIFYPWNYEELDDYIRRIQEEYIYDGPFAREKEYHLINELFITAARGLTSKNSIAPENQELYQSFCSLRFEMLQHYEQPWNTEELCRRVNLEKSQLFSYYQQFFHSTPHADLIQVRMEKAKNLLTNAALPIGLVAQQCGFSDAAHFSRYFKKECGISPRDYGKMPPDM